MKQKVVNLCKTMLQAQANGDMKREQKAYDTLRALCHKHNLDFSNAMEGGMRAAKQSIAIQMRGIH